MASPHNLIKYVRCNISDSSEVSMTLRAIERVGISETGVVDAGWKIISSSDGEKPQHPGDKCESVKLQQKRRIRNRRADRFSYRKRSKKCSDSNAPLAKRIRLTEGMHKEPTQKSVEENKICVQMNPSSPGEAEGIVDPQQENNLRGIVKSTTMLQQMEQTHEDGSMENTVRVNKRSNLGKTIRKNLKTKTRRLNDELELQFHNYELRPTRSRLNRPLSTRSVKTATPMSSNPSSSERNEDSNSEQIWEDQFPDSDEISEVFGMEIEQIWTEEHYDEALNPKNVVSEDEEICSVDNKEESPQIGSKISASNQEGADILLNESIGSSPLKNILSTGPFTLVSKATDMNLHTTPGNRKSLGFPRADETCQDPERMEIEEFAESNVSFAPRNEQLAHILSPDVDSLNFNKNRAVELVTGEKQADSLTLSAIKCPGGPTSSQSIAEADNLGTLSDTVIFDEVLERFPDSWNLNLTDTEEDSQYLGSKNRGSIGEAVVNLLKGDTEASSLGNNINAELFTLVSKPVRTSCQETLCKNSLELPRTEKACKNQERMEIEEVDESYAPLAPPKEHLAHIPVPHTSSPNANKHITGELLSVPRAVNSVEPQTLLKALAQKDLKHKGTNKLAGQTGRISLSAVTNQCGSATIQSSTGVVNRNTIPGNNGSENIPQGRNANITKQVDEPRCLSQICPMICQINQIAPGLASKFSSKSYRMEP